MPIPEIDQQCPNRNIYRQTDRQTDRQRETNFESQEIPSLAQLKVIMTRIHLFLTPDNGHSKVLRDAPIIGFRRAKSLKDILVMAKVSQIKNKGWRGPC